MLIYFADDFVKNLLVFQGPEIYAAPAKANLCEIYAVIYSLMSCRVEIFFDVLQIHANLCKYAKYLKI